MFGSILQVLLSFLWSHKLVYINSKQKLIWWTLWNTANKDYDDGVTRNADVVSKFNKMFSKPSM